MEAQVTAIDDLWWTATKFSDVLRVDRRVCQQALETAPYRMIGKRQVWHVREGFEVIFRRKYGLGESAEAPNPGKLPPRDRLDHYKAERERIKLAQEVRALLPAQEVEQVIGEGLKTLAQGLDVIPDTLERDAGLTPETVIMIQRIIDRIRDQIYEGLMALTVPPVAE